MSLSTPILTVRSSACAALVSEAAAAKANMAISLMTSLPDCGLEAHISCSFYSKLQDRRAAATSWSVLFPSPLWGGVGVGVARWRLNVHARASPLDPPPCPPPQGEGKDQSIGHHRAVA